MQRAVSSQFSQTCWGGVCHPPSSRAPLTTPLLGWPAQAQPRTESAQVGTCRVSALLESADVGCVLKSTALLSLTSVPFSASRCSPVLRIALSPGVTFGGGEVAGTPRQCR